MTSAAIMLQLLAFPFSVLVGDVFFAERFRSDMTVLGATGAQQPA
jgi:hypothetical protein